MRDGGSIPFGANGTIVSICKGKAEVMFDSTYLLGTTLNGKCADPRGASVALKWLLNLSTKELFVHKPSEKHSGGGGQQSVGGVTGKVTESSTANPYQPLDVAHKVAL